MVEGDNQLVQDSTDMSTMGKVLCLHVSERRNRKITEDGLKDVDFEGMSMTVNIMNSNILW